MDSVRDNAFPKIDTTAFSDLVSRSHRCVRIAAVAGVSLLQYGCYIPTVAPISTISLVNSTSSVFDLSNEETSVNIGFERDGDPFNPSALKDYFTAEYAGQEVALFKNNDSKYTATFRNVGVDEILLITKLTSDPSPSGANIKVNSVPVIQSVHNTTDSDVIDVAWYFSSLDGLEYLLDSTEYKVFLKVYSITCGESELAPEQDIRIASSNTAHDISTSSNYSSIFSITGVVSEFVNQNTDTSADECFLNASVVLDLKVLTYRSNNADRPQNNIAQYEFWGSYRNVADDYHAIEIISDSQILPL